MKVGLLGCGRIGRMHADLLASRIGGADVVKVYDAVPELARELAATHSIEAAP